MSNSYPKDEHIRYVETCARRVAANKRLAFVDVIAQSATVARHYLVGVRRPPDDIVHRLHVPFQVVERCIDASSEIELVAKLNEELGNAFPPSS